MTLDHPHAREAQTESKATLGFLLTALGVTLLADRLQIIDVYPGQIWPLILVMIGAGKFRGDGDRWEGAWWMGIGSWMLVITTTSLTFRTTWPVLIIISGVLTIAQSVAGSAARRPAALESREDVRPSGPSGDDNGQ